MQTQLSKTIKDTPLGQEVENILRSCVHCGFCNATCPTYQLLGDELDGPRGRIYLIKQMFEGHDAGIHTQTHLDRCLTCRACETTCPSSVQYGRLLDIGRQKLETSVHRPMPDRLQRWILRKVLPYPNRFGPLFRLARFFNALMPTELKKKLRATTIKGSYPLLRHKRRVLMIPGCVQSVMHPNIDLATSRLLDRCGISVTLPENSNCCGAISHHLGAHDEGLNFIRNNIDQWWPHVESGIEAIVITASACSLMIKDYAYLMRNDPEYSEKAVRISELVSDVSEILLTEDLSDIKPQVHKQRIAFHAPCTLQHGQKLAEHVRDILERQGFMLTAVTDGHICCGSAGAYSILQPELSKQLRDNKIKSLQNDSPDIITTANIGCLMHLQSGTDMRVQHWVELLDTHAPTL